MPVAAQTNLLTNGGFENGLAGWTTVNQITGSKYDDSDPQAAQGQFASASYSDSRNDLSGVQYTTPISQLYATPDTTALIDPGNSFALADMNAAGSHILYQSFIAPSSTLRVSWSMYVYDWSGFDPAEALANQQFARVDLLTANVIDTSPFSSAATSVLYGPGVDSEASQGAEPRWRNYGVDITGLTVGQGYTVRFMVTDTQFVLNQAVDNVGVFATTGTVTPEPATASLLILSLLAMVTTVFVRHRAAGNRL